jgi:hypothetical protein
VHDRRLLGTWKSDRKRTMREIDARTDFTPKAKKFLDGMFGHLVLRYTRTRCHSTLRDSVTWFSYRVVARNAQGVLVVSIDPDEREEALSHIRFEGENSYWISLGSFREFFRRVAPTTATGARARGSRPAARRAPRR